jgi:hypothetical protein
LQEPCHDFLADMRWKFDGCLFEVANENNGLYVNSAKHPDEVVSGNVLPLRKNAMNFCA